MKTYHVMAAVLVAFVVGLALGSVLWKGDTSTAPSEEDGEVAVIHHDRENPTLEQEIADLEADLELARREADRKVRSADAKDAALEEARAGLPARAEPPAAGSPPLASTEEDAPAPQGPRFFADRYNGALKKVDWGIIGRNMSEMVPLIAGIARDLIEKKSPSPEAVGRIQQLNGPLLSAALKIVDDLPGTGVNGKFCDPAFMLNAIVSTLEAAGKPLTEGEERALVEMALARMDELSRIRERHDEDTLDLQKLYEEAEVKDRFFKDVFDLISPEQAEILSPADSRGRVRLDIFSAGLMYVMRVRPIPFEDQQEVVDRFLLEATTQLGLVAGERETVKSAITHWVDRLPRELLEWETDPLDMEGMVHAERATGWAREIVALLKDLSTVIPMSEKRSESIREIGVLQVPIRR